MHWAQYVWEGLDASHCCQMSVARRSEIKVQATTTTLTATKEAKSIRIKSGKKDHQHWAENYPSLTLDSFLQSIEEKNSLNIRKKIQLKISNALQIPLMN